MNSAQSAFIILAHSVLPVQLHWTLKNAWGDSPDTHCVSTLDNADRKDKRDGATKSICRSQPQRTEKSREDKSPAGFWKTNSISLEVWPGLAAQPGRITKDNSGQEPTLGEMICRHYGSHLSRSRKCRCQLALVPPFSLMRSDGNLCWKKSFCISISQRKNEVQGETPCLATCLL